MTLRPDPRRSTALVAVVFGTLGCLGLIACSSSKAPVPPSRAGELTATAPGDARFQPPFGLIEFLGEAVIPSGTEIDGAPVGGLSGITYDEARDLYLAISDDPASRGPARFFTLAIDLENGSLAADGATARAVTGLLDRDGSPFAEMSLDGEGIALTPEDTVYFSSEGQADLEVDPFLREAALDGTFLRSFPVPPKFLPREAKNRGIRHNLGFESLTVSPSGRWFFSSTENALRQDGPETDVGVSSRARILRYERGSGRLDAEFVYVVEPVTAAPPSPDGFRTRGLVELLALSDDHLLALERSYTQGVGNAIDLFWISLDGATDVRRQNRLNREFQPVRKYRLLELAVLGIDLDNVEGMTLGPTLADGRRTLVMVADNNFNARQRNQVLAFALSPGDVAVPRIQGAAHKSPLEGAWALGVRGVVSAAAARGPGFWIQGAPDRDPSTSDALFVRPAGEVVLEPGTLVEVDGLITESAFPDALPVTTLDLARVRTRGTGTLPEPVLIQAKANGTGRTIPAEVIDDDGLSDFQPSDDAIDFFESLEGMRVALSPSVVVGPTTRFGGFAVLIEGSRRQGRQRSPNRGLVASATDINPERIVVAARDRASAPIVGVGDRFDEPIVGNVDYAFGSFRVLSDDFPAPLVSNRKAESSELESSADALVVASYNVENLSASSGAEKYERVARSIVDNLGSPDILALQEIQDDNGAEDDGTVSARETLRLLVDAIGSLGGPQYAASQVDPADLADGGRPGANIRVAYLFRPDRVALVERGAPGPQTAAELLIDDHGPFLSPNPSRIAPDHPAFAADLDRNISGVRKALAAEFEFNGRRLFLINLHLRSKRGDTPVFGAHQPPVRRSETRRVGEARVVRDFVDELLELDPEAAVVVLGDFNEHPYRDPVLLLSGSTLENLVERVPPAERYTYIYLGNSQVLDNFLVSRALAESAAPIVDIVHLNADFPSLNRASDHDPVMVRFSLPAPQDDS